VIGHLKYNVAQLFHVAHTEINPVFTVGFVLSIQVTVAVVDQVLPAKS
jgi:hypothetical protein